MKIRKAACWRAAFRVPCPWRRLRDRRFRLLTRDAAWGNLAIGSMFLANAAELPAFQTVGLAGDRLAASKRSSTQALSAALGRA
jgi:hypothetical protein